MAWLALNWRSRSLLAASAESSCALRAFALANCVAMLLYSDGAASLPSDILLEEEVGVGESRGSRSDDFVGGHAHCGRVERLGQAR